MNSYEFIAAILIIGVSLTVDAQERKLAQKSLPLAVQMTIQEQSHGATIRGYSTEVENGKRVYEAEMTLNGHTKNVEVAADGTLNEIEEEIAFDSLPKPVQVALAKNAGVAKITKVESLTKHQRIVAYEAATLNGNKRGEIQVGPNGENLSHEE